MYLYVSQTLEKQWLSLLVGHKEFAVESVLTLLGRKFDVNISFIKKKWTVENELPWKLSKQIDFSSNLKYFQLQWGHKLLLTQKGLS